MIINRIETQVFIREKVLTLSPLSCCCYANIWSSRYHNLDITRHLGKHKISLMLSVTGTHTLPFPTLIAHASRIINFIILCVIEFKRKSTSPVSNYLYICFFEYVTKKEKHYEKNIFLQSTRPQQYNRIVQSRFSGSGDNVDVFCFWQGHFFWITVKVKTSKV